MNLAHQQYSVPHRKTLLDGRSGNHLEANKFTVEVVKTLTPRLSDSQSNLKPLAASALAEVASSVTPDSAIKVPS